VTIDTVSTGYAQAVARVREINAQLGLAADPSAAAAPAFSSTLSSAMGDASGVASAAELAPVATLGGGGTTGQRIADIATRELGVAEQPPGSNDGPRIAEYRTATRGSGVGPWCAYFTSWVAQQAGVPVGPTGGGIGWVPTMKSWAEQTGRWVPSGGGAPQVGDLVVFERNGDGVPDHIGVVTGVRPDGGITTVEGNSSDRVSQRSYSGPGDYAGLVRLSRS
jgi:cell wall-associated NlpC family hydrolase